MLKGTIFHLKNKPPASLHEVQPFSFLIVKYSIIVLLLHLSSVRGADIKIKGLYFNSMTLFYS